MILSFHSKMPKGEQRLNLGAIDKDTHVSYRLCDYQQRAVYLPGEPLVSGSYTRQPVVTLVQGEVITPLPYATDVKALGEDLALKVLDRLK